MKQKVLDGVVRDKEIEPPVIIYVSCYNSQAFAQGFRNLIPVAHFGERSVSVVVIQQISGRLEHAGYAIVVAAKLVIAAGNAVALVFDKATQEQVKTSVAVIVEPDTARGPSRRVEL